MQKTPNDLHICLWFDQIHEYDPGTWIVSRERDDDGASSVTLHTFGPNEYPAALAAAIQAGRQEGLAVLKTEPDGTKIGIDTRSQDAASKATKPGPDLKAMHRICGEVLETHMLAILDEIKKRLAAELGCEFRVKHFARPCRHVYLIETGPEIVKFPDIDQSLIQVLTVAIDSSGEKDRYSLRIEGMNCE